jgi:N-acetylglucosaminyl-diphospho-decaprenol L-rhamnosyltransferase
MAEKIPEIQVVIVNYRTPGLAMRCVDALADERGSIPSIRVVVVDGGSGDDSVEILRAGLDRARFIGWTELLPLTINGGFGWVNNQAIMYLLQGQSPPDFIYLVNPDAKVAPSAILPLIQELNEFPNAAACGSRLVDTEGRTLGSAFRFPTPMREFARGLRTQKLSRLLGFKDTVIETSTSMEVDWVTGASVLIRSAALRQTGLFDDGFFLYFEEVELMWRLRRAGWTIRHAPASRVLHIGGAATGVVDVSDGRRKRLPSYWYQSRRRFFVHCYGPLQTIFAGTMWLSGHILWRLRVLAGRRKDAVPYEGRDHIRFSLIPRLRDSLCQVPRWNGPRGAEPAWRRANRQ